MFCTGYFLPSEAFIAVYVEVYDWLLFMKKIFLSLLCATVLVSPVLAEASSEKPVEAAATEADVDTTSFEDESQNGFYAGLQGMWAMQRVKKDDNDAKQVLAREFLKDPKGFAGGAFFGYAHTFNRFYLAGELAYAYGAVNGKKNVLNVNVNTPGGRVAADVKTKVQPQHFVDVALHLGVALPHGFTPYAVLGLRYIRGKINVDARATVGGATVASFSGDQKVHGIGPRLGLGLRWKPNTLPFFAGVESALSYIEMKEKGNERFDGIKTHNVDVKVKVGYSF